MEAGFARFKNRELSASPMPLNYRLIIAVALIDLHSLLE